MTTSFTATYENGVLRPNVPLSLAEGETVQVSLNDRQTPSVPLSDDEIDRRIDSAKTLKELFAAMNDAPDDPEYDLLAALDENRRRSGASRVLFPPENKGVTW